QPRSLRSALLFCYYNARPRDHPSFPTRRSSDLGLVTAGAAAAMVVGYAGMMTEDLEPRMRDIPDVSNFPRNEVIIQKSHRYPFDHQIRQTGAKLVEVDPRGNDCRQSTRKLWPFTLPIS